MNKWSSVLTQTNRAINRIILRFTSGKQFQSTNYSDYNQYMKSYLGILEIKNK